MVTPYILYSFLGITSENSTEFSTSVFIYYLSVCTRYKAYTNSLPASWKKANAHFSTFGFLQHISQPWKTKRAKITPRSFKILNKILYFWQNCQGKELIYQKDDTDDLLNLAKEKVNYYKIKKASQGLLKVNQWLEPLYFQVRESQKLILKK